MSRSVLQWTRRFSSKVNGVYQPGLPKAPAPSGSKALPASTPSIPDVEAILDFHNRELGAQDLRDLTADHTIFTWMPSKVGSDNALHISRAEGVYFYDVHGKRYLDFNSMAMCANLGHTVPKEVVEGITSQLESCFYAYPGVFTTPVRARLCKLLSQITPGDINAFIFPSSGAEANEIAIRMARAYTGRHKILSRYRSYHGGTQGALAMTGDQRRWPTENGATGFVKFFDPYPYSFKWGETEEEITENSLNYLRETIAYEGGHTIAAIFMETITGTNGVLPPPRGYLEGVREICDEHGIQMVCDEVMAGFGRSGRVFSYQHYGIVPDMVTFAKGVNSAYVPLGGLGARDHLAEHFRTHPLGIGSTYNGHPVALASAYYAIKHMLEHRVIENSAAMGTVLSSLMEDVAARHPSVKQYRNLGLFGCIDIAKNKRGDFIAKVADPLPPAMGAFKADLLQRGLFTMMRGHNVFTNPPLVISEEELREGVSIIDQSLSILDEAMED